MACTNGCWYFILSSLAIIGLVEARIEPYIFSMWLGSGDVIVTCKLRCYIACCSTILPSCFVLGLVQMDINSTFFVMWPRIDDTIATCKLRPLDASLIPCRVYRSYLSDLSLWNLSLSRLIDIWMFSFNKNI